MRKVPLGASGIEVSEFVFGAGSIGGVGASVKTRAFGLSAEQGFERLDEAVALGLNLIDTADSYGGGESEKVVGRWLRDRRPENLLVASKVGLVSRPDGSRGIDLSGEHIARQLAQSVERLGRVDLYLSHAPDPVTPIEETIEAFAAAQEAGTIGAYGVSNVSRQRLESILHAADARGLPRPVSVENRLNLLDRADEAELLPLVMREGIGYTPFSPLAGGVLSERYLDGAPPQAGSRIAVAGDMYYKGFHSPENLERVAALREIARERLTSVSGLALAWLRDHPGVTAPIVAPSTSAQWDAVTDAMRIRLDEKEFDRISEIFA
ncbi:aldo/keto reductase [Spongiactinospora sp. TRM90649]|uniref:aldo/keto reductase n=1 Tax=Spongiactinospora sp. TRM90649 TaxID=3031114 RepID=UPI0023F8B2C4|nr:aldo/keto reductase [Spongiactinospora sp. TRM90649]MDF5753575.1 aldo/keto reductase [Spongiactinospora sp. TRM90649]